MTTLRVSSAFVLLALISAATSASAHDFHTGSQVTITRLSLSAGAVGKVTSSRTFCRAHRKVVLYRHVAGGNVPVGSTKTDRNGVWKIKGPLPAAFDRKYKAKAPRKAETGHGHRHVCSGAKSSFAKY